MNTKQETQAIEKQARDIRDVREELIAELQETDMKQPTHTYVHDVLEPLPVSETTKHTKEPWMVSEDGLVHDTYDAPIARLGPHSLFAGSVGERNANGRRIVACVNACAGMPLDWLEGTLSNGGIDKLLQKRKDERDTLKAQRDELLKELKKELMWLQHIRTEVKASTSVMFGFEQAVKSIGAAIENATKEPS